MHRKKRWLLTAILSFPLIGQADPNNPLYPPLPNMGMTPHYQYPITPQYYYPTYSYPAPYTLGSYPNWYYPPNYGQAMNRPRQMPPPMPKKKTPKAWGDVRNIWPDFYTDFTSEAWDKMMFTPYDMGYMPGGWRFPSISTPDPVTVGDAVANQLPPLMDESGNFMNFAN